MNERIRQLKHQASVWCDQNIPDQFSEETNGYGAAWEDKFAELLIRECAEVSFTHWQQHKGCSAHFSIREHFGVKE